ncbi:MAG: hypothetical protein ACREQY_09795, partial [Candidatus Binatia bacterium]
MDRGDERLDPAILRCIQWRMTGRDRCKPSAEEDEAMNADQVVTAFCNAVTRGNLDEAMKYIAEDCVY